MDMEEERGKRKQLRVLLVEDSADIREAFTLLLRAEGVDVIATASGREATELAASRDFRRRAHGSRLARYPR
jgi:CheY-like chemotaxis protein